MPDLMKGQTAHTYILSLCLQRVHGSLLQRSHQIMESDSPVQFHITLLPVALREAAFFESADCYTAMIANEEVLVSSSISLCPAEMRAIDQQ